MSNKKETNKAPTIDPNEAQKAPETKKNEEKGKAGDVLPEFLAPYRKAYPKCRAFHVTSDRMVFLESDRNAALVHQQSLGEGTVETFKMKKDGKTER